MVHLCDDTFSSDDEYIKRSIGHRDYGMYGYDLKLNHVIGNHDIK